MQCEFYWNGDSWRCSHCGLSYRSPLMGPRKPPRHVCRKNKAGYAKRRKAAMRSWRSTIVVPSEIDGNYDYGLPTKEQIGQRTGEQLHLLVVEHTGKHPQRSCKRDPGKRMGKKGLTWCKEHVDKIAEWFQELHVAERWHVHLWPGYDEDPDEAVRSMIRKAIERAGEAAQVK